MNSIRRAACLTVVLIVGSMALPPQSLRNHSRSADKTKETTSLYSNMNQSGFSMITPNSTDHRNSIPGIVIGSAANDNTIDAKMNKNVDNSVSKPLLRPLGVPVTIGSDATMPPLLPFSSSAGTMLTDRNSLVDTIEQSSTISSISDTRTDAGITTAAFRDANTSTGTSLAAAVTTMSNVSSNSNTGTSATPTEASSRTITSIQDATAYPSSSKISTTSFNEFTTTPSSISSKETRESPGKIRPQIKLTTNYSSLSETGVRLPEGASAALAKPTKYHYYPHNQHIYLLPECAVQQVCNAVYVRLNFTQPLCACPGRYRDPCSASLDSDDLHTTELVTDPRTKALTLVKTCEPVAEMRECRTPKDWSLLALQNVRTGKSHYLVICRCPDANILEGPMIHDQPTYASVPGIRVYGMICVQGSRRGRPLRHTRSLSDYSPRETYNRKEERNERLSFPWYKVQQLMDSIVWD